MRIAVRTVSLVAATILLSACGMFDKDEDKELEPTELVDIETKIDVRRVWSTNIGRGAEFLRVALQPAGDGTRIYAASRDGNVVALDPESGKTIWRTELDIELSAGPGVGENIVVVGAADGDLVAFQADTGVESGQLLWAREVSTYEGVSADWNNLYTVDEEGVVIAMTRRTGDESWRQSSLIRREPTVPVPFQTTVVVGDLEGYLHFFNNFDGDPVARLRAGNKAVSVEPVVYGDQLFVQGDDGSVSAYRIRQAERPGNAPEISDDDA
ncbi:MAG: PQQ-binding-like beta-propeller repeat protein [Woeseiaceae bacterium]